MQFRSIRELKSFKGKTVLLRTDFNVPVTNGMVDATEDFRLTRVVPTIRFLVRRGARVIILSHRGRPDGVIREDLRLTPVASRLQQLFHTDSAYIEEWGVKFRPGLTALFPFYTIIPNRVWMLENLRFDPNEETNDASFAKTLASLADIYVNDAFAVSHRKNASVHAITKYLPSYAGLLMEEEVQHLSSVFNNPKRPLAIVIGGAKISTKIGLITQCVQHADHVLLGGALANTLLHAKGFSVGRSLMEVAMIKKLKGLDLTDSRLHLPVDCVVARSVKSTTRVTSVGAVRAHEAIYDIGPDTVALFSHILGNARMIVWNGPLGLFEEKAFAQSTFDVLRVALQNTRAKIIIGGGETVTAYRQYLETINHKLKTKNVFLSTGGGAMLEFLEKGMLPGVQPLLKNKS